MPNRTLHVIYVPGLDNGRYTLRILSWLWSRGGVKLHPHTVRWKDDETLEPKLQGLLEHIDALLETGDPVALIGASAGASLVCIAFAKRPQLVGVANVCGRMLVGHGTKVPLEQAAGKSRAFEQSVRMCHRDLWELYPLRERILALKPWRDPVVPLATMSPDWVAIKRVAGFLHVDGIILALLFRRRTILRFFRRSTSASLATIVA